MTIKQGKSISKYFYNEKGLVKKESVYKDDKDDFYVEYYFEYDDHGNMIKRRNSFDEYVESFVYDDNGNLIYDEMADTKYEYDEYNRLIRTIDGHGVIWSESTYNGDTDKLATYKHRCGIDDTYVYDETGKLIKIFDNITNEVSDTYTYDDEDRLSIHTNTADHFVCTYEYDNRNNVTKEIISNRTDRRVVIIINNYTYNDDNQCICKETEETSIYYNNIDENGYEVNNNAV